MMIEEAKRRLEGAGYTLLPVLGEAMCICFWPMDNDGHRRTQGLNNDQIIALAMKTPLAGDDDRNVHVDISRVGVVGVLRKLPMTTDSEGEPKLQIVVEITGRNAVNSVPVDDLRDMMGELVLLQLHSAQKKIEWRPGTRREG